MCIEWRNASLSKPIWKRSSHHSFCSCFSSQAPCWSHSKIGISSSSQVRYFIAIQTSMLAPCLHSIYGFISDRKLSLRIRLKKWSWWILTRNRKHDAVVSIMKHMKKMIVNKVLEEACNVPLNRYFNWSVVLTRTTWAFEFCCFYPITTIFLSDKFSHRRKYSFVAFVNGCFAWKQFFTLSLLFNHSTF